MSLYNYVDTPNSNLVNMLHMPGALHGPDDDADVRPHVLLRMHPARAISLRAVPCGPIGVERGGPMSSQPDRALGGWFSEA
ncbi:hypothetical protein CVT25_008202 [Psilocybe cyanescens]|uniref:Uncharacterized protein n=1 Tax=Psilocybe cyanescens TaxID=93625 RepID=A0A409X9M3_PSICY|nr:hypothetical protein CVT25_008202 [Psilocybe cyanescens]